IGKSDLKAEIGKYLVSWNWNKPVEDLLEYWFTSESKVDDRILDHIRSLREKGVKCYLHTNNEKYRTEFLLNELDFNKVFDGAFSSSYLGYLKPQKEFWEHIAETIKISSADALVWDDDKENVESAAEYGFLARQYADFENYQTEMQGLLS
ncbi:MAG TPA: HAD family hydrolase, partial [Candidatus Paceibacterota bacterium]